MKSHLVRLKLAAPVAQNGRIALDSILAHALFLRDGVVGGTLPLARFDGENVLPPGPLEPGQVHMGSIVLRSAGHFVLNHTHIRAIRPTISFGNADAHDEVWKERRGNRSTIVIPDTKRGPYQNLMKHYDVVHAAHGMHDEANVVYFRFTGDGAAVRDLLAELPGIGKKTSCGFGQIAMRDGKPEIDLFDVKGGIPGVVGLGGTPERAVPRDIWNKLVAAGSAQQDVPGEYCAMTVPYFRSPAHDCVVPQDDFGMIGYIDNGEGVFVAVKSLDSWLAEWFGVIENSDAEIGGGGFLDTIAREDRV